MGPYAAGGLSLGTVLIFYGVLGYNAGRHYPEGVRMGFAEMTRMYKQTGGLRQIARFQHWWTYRLRGPFSSRE